MHNVINYHLRKKCISFIFKRKQALVLSSVLMSLFIKWGMLWLSSTTKGCNPYYSMQDITETNTFISSTWWKVSETSLVLIIPTHQFHKLPINSTSNLNAQFPSDWELMKYWLPHKTTERTGKTRPQVSSTLPTRKTP